MTLKDMIVSTVFTHPPEMLVDPALRKLLQHTRRTSSVSDRPVVLLQAGVSVPALWKLSSSRLGSVYQLSGSLLNDSNGLRFTRSK